VLTYCAVSDRGGRKTNEDAYENFILEHQSGRLHVLAVADGLGGHRAGEIASKLAIIELKETLKRSIGDYENITSEAMRELLAKAYRKANEEILYQGNMTPERRGMGTTLLVALLNEEGKGVVANVGDSRAYLIADGIKWRTKDHSYVQELVDRGVITQEESAKHPDKNIVTKMVGMQSAVPDFYECDLIVGALLLSTDGLIDSLSDEEIKNVIVNSEIQNLCKKLVEKAKPKSDDNITVIVARRT